MEVYEVKIGVHRLRWGCTKKTGSDLLKTLIKTKSSPFLAASPSSSLHTTTPARCCHCTSRGRRDTSPSTPATTGGIAGENPTSQIFPILVYSSCVRDSGLLFFLVVADDTKSSHSRKAMLAGDYRHWFQPLSVLHSFPIVDSLPPRERKVP